MAYSPAVSPPPSPPSRPTLGRILVVAAALVIVVAGLQAARQIISPILLGAFVAILATPLEDRLLRRGWPRVAAMATTITVVALILVAFVVASAVAVLELGRRLPAYQDEFQALVEQIDEVLVSIGISSSVAELLAGLDLSQFVQQAVSVARNALSLTTMVLLGGLIAAYLLLEVGRAERRARMAFGGRREVVDRFEGFARSLRTYLVVRAKLGLLAAVLDVVLLLVVGVPFAVLWGVLSFATSFIPNVGFIIALVPPALIALLEGGWVPALIVVVGYVAINLVVDYAVQPRYMGAEVDLSPLVVILSLLAWTFIVGPIGAILAVPLTLVVVTILDSFDESRWLAVLMHDRVPAEVGGTPPAPPAGPPPGSWPSPPPGSPPGPADDGQSRSATSPA
jgi:AI-2 transport protein TqsA